MSEKPEPTERASTDGEAGGERGQPFWSFRGYNLRSSEFTAAMTHFYRGEVERSNVWRRRLDTTTNWAVITAGVSTLLALADPTLPPVVFFLAMLLVTIFWLIEARRYRYYELWSYRVRLMETDFFAAMLVPPFQPHADWAENLAETLLNPEFPISQWEAFGRRFRRNYAWIFVVLAAAWALKTLLQPQPAADWPDFVARAALGPIPGEVILLGGLVYLVVLFSIGYATVGLRRSSGEVLPKLGDVGAMAAQVEEMLPTDKRGAAILRITRRRQQLLAIIITTQPEQIARRILQEMRRGVTGLHGKGMYTGQEREVLLVAVTVTEMSQLKDLARGADPNAFIMVAPAREILGRGFQSLSV